MAKMLDGYQNMRIKKRNREFAERFPGWMCEGSEDSCGTPCNIIFNNETEESFLASYAGEVIETEYVKSTPRRDLEEMARIQGEIRRIAEG